MTHSINFLTLVLPFLVWGCQEPTQSSDFSIEEDTKKVKEILKVIDDLGKNMDATMSVFSDELVHMAQGSRAITNKAELRKVLEAESSYGKTMMTHEIISLHSYHDLVLTRGRVKGTWTPPGGAAIPFETNNMITFRRMGDGSLKVWHVIFNRVSLENYKE